MKNYKLLIPIALAVLLVLSAYMLYSSRKSTEETYQGLLAEARSYVEKGITVDAESKYMEAFEYQPSAELAVEIGKAYLQLGQKNKFRNWGERSLEEYPTETRIYELLIENYEQSGDYATCFELAKTFRARKLTSKKVEEIMQRIAYTFEFNEGYEQVGAFGFDRCPVLEEDRWAYAKPNGAMATKHAFVRAGAFSGAGLAPVVDLQGEAYFIDPDGNKKQIVEGVENVVELGYIAGDTFPLYNGETWAFYNLSGKRLFGDYDEVSALANGVAAVRQGDLWTLIDAAGKPITKDGYYSVVQDGKTVVCRNDRIFVEQIDGYHMIDPAGKQYGQVYEDVCLFNDSTYAAVQVNGKWGFVDVAGKLVIEPQYEQARSFSNGFAAVRTGGLWGFIDLNNNMVITPQFVDARDFTDKGSVFVIRTEDWEMLRLFSFEYGD